MPIQPKQQPPYYEPGTGTTAPLEYEALIAQTGTNAPVMTIQKNTIGNIVWTRSAAGSYNGTLAGAFPAGKVTVYLCGNYEAFYTWYPTTPPDVIQIFSGPPGGLSDGYMDATSIKITVYP